MILATATAAHRPLAALDSISPPSKAHVALGGTVGDNGLVIPLDSRSGAGLNGVAIASHMDAEVFSADIEELEHDIRLLNDRIRRLKDERAQSADLVMVLFRVLRGSPGSTSESELAASRSAAAEDNGEDESETVDVRQLDVPRPTPARRRQKLQEAAQLARDATAKLFPDLDKKLDASIGPTTVLGGECDVTGSGTMTV